MQGDGPQEPQGSVASLWAWKIHRFYIGDVQMDDHNDVWRLRVSSKQNSASTASPLNRR